ncbi:MAG: type II toxin-antitoxin system VapC family toxin [Candidatus Omnitrophica bacterium]|nr:type II toxin-antitoxin system VapC family toxin [Candidatus Omnitrophota bacterium]
MESPGVGQHKQARVLVDTSIWISHFGQENSQLIDLLSNSQVLCHDFVLGELALGHFQNKKILPLLQTLPKAPLVKQDEILYFIQKHELTGSGIGFVDVHLLASSQLYSCLLWTQDSKLRQTASKLHSAYS